MKVIKCISVIFIIFSAGTLSLAGDDSMEDYLSIYDFNKTIITALTYGKILPIR